MTDYCGAIVKLKQTLHTRGGETFEKGTTMICTTTWRGMLNLRCATTRWAGTGRSPSSRFTAVTSTY